MPRLSKLKAGTRKLLSIAKSRRGVGYSKANRKHIANALRTQRRLKERKLYSKLVRTRHEQRKKSSQGAPRGWGSMPLH